MEVAKFIWENIKIFSIVLFALAFLQVFIKPVYTRVKNILANSKGGKFLIGTNIVKIITVIISPVVLIAVLITLQQKYGFIQLGNKDNYNALVISILTLYGILYTFLQFTISYALQNKIDKYWGRSIAKRLFIKRLGFEVFESSIFKILLLYTVAYPLLSEAIFAAVDNLQISNDFPQALWEVSILIIYILYAYLFMKSLNSMRILYDIQEGRNSWLEWEIEEAVAEEYKRSFEHSYNEENFHFLNRLFNEVESLNKKEQNEMIMHVLRKALYELEFIQSRRNAMYMLFKQEHEFNKYFYLHNFFNRLYDKIEKSNIELGLPDLLDIYQLHDKAIYQSIASSHVKKGEFFDKLINVYSNGNNLTNDKNCTYFKLPSVIEKRISSFDDIEEIHKRITRRKSFEVIQSANKSNSLELTESEKVLVNSYKMYVDDLLEYYKGYLDVLKHRQYSYFWGSLRSYNRADLLDEWTSDRIYEYIIRLEHTAQNIEYVLFLAEKLDYKYKVSMIFYHMLYPGPSWEWKEEVLIFRQIINNIWVNKAITDEDLLEFVCHKIENSNIIDHRIRGDLIRWISQQISIRRLNEEIVDRCLSEQHMSYAKLLKFIYIFSDNRHYPINFYDFDFSNVKAEANGDWRVEFLLEMLNTPKLLSKKFFSRHLLYYCEKISYTTDHFVFINDFRVFFINPFFELSESQFNDLFDKHYPGKGIMEFLILHLTEKEYEYLTEGTASKSFLSRVKKIINYENKPIGVYVKSLVSQANECRDSAVSVVKETEIINRLRFMFKQ